MFQPPIFRGELAVSFKAGNLSTAVFFWGGEKMEPGPVRALPQKNRISTDQHHDVLMTCIFLVPKYATKSMYVSLDQQIYR